MEEEKGIYLKMIQKQTPLEMLKICSLVYVDNLWAWRYQKFVAVVG